MRKPDPSLLTDAPRATPTAIVSSNSLIATEISIKSFHSVAKELQHFAPLRCAWRVPLRPEAIIQWGTNQ
jgi:hypothetical protein